MLSHHFPTLIQPVPEVVITIDPENVGPKQKFISDFLAKYEPTPKHIFFEIVGLGIAAIGALYEFNLGANFGERINEKFALENSSGRAIIRDSFAIISATTATALIGLPIRNYLLDFINVNILNYQPEFRYNLLRKVCIYFARFLCALSPLPFMYELKIIFEGNAAKQIALCSISGVAGYICSLTTMYPRVNWIFERFNKEPYEIKIKREQLLAKFEEIIFLLKSEKNPIIDTLYEFSKEHDNENIDDFDAKFICKVKQLLFCNDLPPCNAKNFSLKKFSIDLMSNIVGAIATCGLFYLSNQSLEWAMREAKIEETPTLSGMKNFISVLDLIPVCIFFGNFVQMRVEDYLYKFGNINLQTSHIILRNFLNFFSLFIGIFAASPNIDITIQSYEDGQTNIVFVPITAIGLTFANAKSIDLLMQAIVDMVDWYFLKNNEEVRRDYLINIVNFLKIEIIPHAHPMIINKIYNAVFENNLTESQASIRNERSSSWIKSSSFFANRYEEKEIDPEFKPSSPSLC